MRLKFWAIGLFSVISWLVLFAPIQAQDTQNFVINSFDADYYLTKNSDNASNLDVVETITVTFPDYDQNHGILRAIPESYQNHTLSLKIKSVQNTDGGYLSYTTYKQNDNLVLKIGLPDVYVHGQQTYVISYSMKDVVTILPDKQEFYWNVNGNQWPQPFYEVSAKVHIPTSLTTQLQDNLTCYTGYIGSIDQTNCRISSIKASSGALILVATKSGLDSYDSLSFITTFNKDTFVLGPEVAHQKRIQQIELIGGIAAAVVLPLLILIFMFYKWRRYGDDPKGRGVIIPEYEPPKELDPLYADFLLKEKLRGTATSAAIIDLATQGYVTIFEIPKKGWFGKKDYELQFKALPEKVLPLTTEALTAIFGPIEDGTSVKLSEITSSNSQKRDLAKKMKDVEKHLSLAMKTLGYFSNDPLKTRTIYSVVGVIVIVAGGALFKIDAGIEPNYNHFLIYPAIGLAVSGLIILLFSRIMPARSQKGVELHDQLLGLKDYIKLAEADRLKFLQSPEGAEKISSGSYDPKDPKMKVKLFESLLPYAMLFGLEKDWAKQFANIYKTPPGWYQGDWATFNAVYLASSISSFSSANSVTFAGPSGGGGGAGGGGGGGGGGGW